MNFLGVIIEESLRDPSILKHLKVVSTKTELVTPEHKTPWLTQWTLHHVEVPEQGADAIAEQIRHALEKRDSWYADFKNENIHFIIYPDRVFKIDRSKREEYQAATSHGIDLGIPDYQVDFSPHVKEWTR